jgi:hypothetical protein
MRYTHRSVKVYGLDHQSSLHVSKSPFGSGEILTELYTHTHTNHHTPPLLASSQQQEQEQSFHVGVGSQSRQMR